MSAPATLLPMLRARVGIDPSDSSKDDDINAAWDMALALAETYCDRWFSYQTDASETFTHDGRMTCSLKRYPLESVASVTTLGTDGAPVDGYDFDAASGVVYLHGVFAHQYKVTYTGGFQTFPPDLLFALLLTFDNCWQALFETSASDDAEQAVKAMTVPDVGRLEYATGTESESSPGYGAFAALPSNAVALLSRYRRELA